MQSLLQKRIQFYFLVIEHDKRDQFLFTFYVIDDIQY